MQIKAIHLQRIGKLGHEINTELGKYWHKELPDSFVDYENPDFIKVEGIYNYI